MGYSADMLKHLVKVYNLSGGGTQGSYGLQEGSYALAGTIHAAVDWSRGVKAMRQGALDAYDTVMVRCRWNEYLKRDSRIEVEGVMYVIDSYHADKEANTIQVTATEMTV